MKTIITLYVDAEAKANAKAKGINISQLFNEFMSVELEIIEKNKNKTDKEQIKILKMALAIQTEHFIERTKELEKLKKKEKLTTIPWR